MRGIYGRAHHWMCGEQAPVFRLSAHEDFPWGSERRILFEEDGIVSVWLEVVDAGRDAVRPFDPESPVPDDFILLRDLSTPLNSLAKVPLNPGL